MKKKIIVYIYNSFNDPLLQSSLYQYILDNAQSGKYLILLITYEQEDYYIAPAQKQEIKEKLASQNIIWKPLDWHSGRFKIIKKLYDLSIGAFVVFWYRLFLGYRRIISFGTVAGSFAHLLSRFLLMKHFLYQYEPHSEFLLDGGIWTKKALSWRMLHYLERRAGMKSAILATGTHYMIERLKTWNSPALVYWVPSCVNEQVFDFDADKRLKIRNKLSVGERQVLIYIGKFGGIYYPADKVALVFKAFYEALPDKFFFLILSPQDKDSIESAFREVGLPPELVHIDKAPFSDIPSYLSAADFGLVAVPPQPSQKFRSPIKVGEYLCCGLPYLVCRGISEDDIWAEKENVGVVVEDFTQEELSASVPKVLALLSENKESLRQRCRKTGIAYRGLSVSIPKMREIFEKL